MMIITNPVILKESSCSQKKEIVVSVMFHPLETYQTKICIDRNLSTKGDWNIKYMTIYVSKNNRYEDITSLYSETILSEILKEILLQLKGVSRVA